MADLGDWGPALADEMARPYWAELSDFVERERRSKDVYPAADQVFRALELCPLAQVRVVVLGQDPYHGPGQANGLAFSVSPGVKIPPSLRNIFTELESDVGVPTPDSGDLTPWAQQGILLLNTTLTVACGEAGSHQGHGWSEFTDSVIAAVDRLPRRVVFVLWGAAARSKATNIDSNRHVVIESAHPSPLSAYRGFIGSRPFSQINAALTESDQNPIDWRLPAASTLW